MVKDHIADVEARLCKKKKKLSSLKASNNELKKKLSDAIYRANKAERRVELVEANALKAIEDYKKLVAFEAKVTKAWQ